MNEKNSNIINPINYKLHIEPDFKKFLFYSTVSISLTADEPVYEVLLNAVDLAIWKCQIYLEKDVWKNCSFSLDPEKEQLTVKFPNPLNGDILLKIDFIGEINNKMSGFYRSNAYGPGSYIAVTQFQESDARRAFPCMDSPSKKATFDIEMLIDQQFSAISNCPIEEEKYLGDGKKSVRFKQTPKMSTYLVSYCVGEFAFLEAQSKGRSVRVAANPKMIRYTKEGLENALKSLEYCESYYDIPYPLPKLDLVVISDFAAGAMENWGMMTFRENLLLYYTYMTSSYGRFRIFEVIAHETVHQWFGDLVTPSDWKYLWLNESFATYFGFGIIAHFKPEWRSWDIFLSTQVEPAFKRDELPHTVPIEINGQEHDAINTSTAPIIYNKGGSMLRQLHEYLGETTFQKGLQIFLKTHSYNVASSNHFWEAMEQASEKPVVSMVKNWIEQPGYPMVSVDISGDTINLSQKRFSVMQENWDQKWFIPITMQVFYRDKTKENIKLLFQDETTKIKCQKEIETCKVNSEQAGFYRVKYDTEHVRKLGELAGQKLLSPIDRWGLLTDQYAIMMRGDETCESYLKFLDYYKDETDFLPLMAIDSSLFNMHVLLKDAMKARIKNFGKQFVEQILDRIGYEPNENESTGIRMLRDQMLWHATIYDSKRAFDFISKQFENLFYGKEVHSDIHKAICISSAWLFGQDAYQYIYQRFEESKVEHERMDLLTALGHFQIRSYIEMAQMFLLEKVPQRNIYIGVYSMAENERAIGLLWNWFIKENKFFKAMHTMHFERILGAVISMGCFGRENELMQYIETDLKQQKKVQDDVIDLCMDRYRMNLKFINRYKS